MGGACSGGGGTSQVASTENQKTMNKEIEDKIKRQRNEEKESVKVLLLGAGECGKSTILKQMKIINMSGFTEEENCEARDLIHKNTLDSIQSLIAAVNDLGIKWGDSGDTMPPEAVKLAGLDSSEKIPLDIFTDIDAMWKHASVKAAKERESEFHLLDSAPYFFNKVLDTFKEGYLPTQQDVLRTRLTTTGIIETEFTLDSTAFKMYDVGGQRGERKKWIHCFDDVTAIMFIASLSEYNQVLAEDRNRNRLTESLDLFEGIANLPWFEKASIILFLNKNDLFEEKVLKIDIQDYHPEYTGGLNYDNGLTWIQEEYYDRNENEEKTLYCHVTDATNTQNVTFVWKATESIILEQKLKSTGLSM